MNGTIKKKTDRGFGFISQPGDTNDLFFHGNDLVGITFDELNEGTEVTFDIEAGQKGPSAKNVMVAGQTETEQETETVEETETETEEQPETEQETETVEETETEEQAE